MFERFTWELRATLLGNQACKARNARARDADARDARKAPARARARDARDARNACNARPTNTAALTHTTRSTQNEPRPRPTGIGDEAGANSAGGRGLTP